MSSTLKRVKEVVEKFGDPQQKNIVKSELNDIDHRLPILGEAAVDTVSRIEKLFASTPIIEISDAVKIRAAQRAIDKLVPFHRQRNGIDDVILIEVYTDVIGEDEVAGNRFAFISHNINDFSHPNANKSYRTRILKIVQLGYFLPINKFNLSSSGLDNVKTDSNDLENHICLIMEIKCPLVKIRLFRDVVDRNALETLLGH